MSTPTLSAESTQASTWIRVWNRFHLHPWGLVGATVLFTLGLTPSLLTRDWFYQGLVSGVASGCGYAIGVALHWIWHRFIADRWAIRERTAAIIEVVMTAVAFIWLVAMVILARGWQEDLGELTSGEQSNPWAFLLVLPVGVLLLLLMVVLGRGILWTSRWLKRVLPSRWTPTARGALAWIAVMLGLVFLIENAIPGTLVAGAERVFSVANADPEEGTAAPEVAERSGSKESHIDFDTVGAYGSRFLNQGLTGDELSEALGTETPEPIRLYAGVASAPTDTARAELIIDELERTEAADRDAMLLIMATGTGWINHQAAQAFEMLHGGDTAVVSEQYSSVPSAYHFLAGGELVSSAGRDFITPIVDWWNDLPEDDRPELYLHGESLGTTGVESAFSGLRDIANSVDGILLTGPPNFNPHWREFTSHRDPHSPEVMPEYEDGRMVRFANEVSHIRDWYGDDSPGESWGPTRMLYVQYPSDPVVWWSRELILQEPDWLKEPAGFDRLPAMQWLPVVTFLQVAADLPVSQNVSDGHGHNYGDAMLDGFAAIAGPDRFTHEEVDSLRPALEEAVAHDAR